jgi:tRNA(Ile)-lysidine synthase
MNAAVDRMWFLGEPIAVQRRAVKAIGEQAGIALEFKHVEEVLSFAAEECGKGKQLSLPLGWKVAKQPDQLIFMTPDLREPKRFQDYEYDLAIPGRVAVLEVGLTIEASRILAGSDAGYNPEQLLDADSLPGRLRVRNWRAGDRFWPCHTKSPKKIKELLQELHLTQPQRKVWPIVSSGDEIVWVRGFPIATQFRARPGGPAVQILERPLAGDIEQS